MENTKIHNGTVWRRLKAGEFTNMEDMFLPYGDDCRSLEPLVCAGGIASSSCTFMRDTGIYTRQTGVVIDDSEYRRLKTGEQIFPQDLLGVHMPNLESDRGITGTKARKCGHVWRKVLSAPEMIECELYDLLPGDAVIRNGDMLRLCGQWYKAEGLIGHSHNQLHTKPFAYRPRFKAEEKAPECPALPALPVVVGKECDQEITIDGAPYRRIQIGENVPKGALFFKYPGVPGRLGEMLDPNPDITCGNYHCAYYLPAPAKEIKTQIFGGEEFKLLDESTQSDMEFDGKTITEKATTTKVYEKVVPKAPPQLLREHFKSMVGMPVDGYTPKQFIEWLEHALTKGWKVV